MDIALPYTIDNALGEKITFKRITVKDGIPYLEGENEVAPGSGPPMHVHFHQDESFTVVSGKLGYQVPGQPEKFAGHGETVLFKAGVPHKFRNAGSQTLHCTGYITPPDNAVYFLAQVFTSTSRNGGRPALYDIAYLLHRYRSEFAMLEIPAFVQKFVFPVVRFYGYLAGKHRKFADAPPPLYS